MEFISFLKENENCRKLFGKREIKIIEKQLLGIALTQSEKNRLSRDIRKKLEAINELNKFSPEFNLKKGADLRKKIDEAKKFILDDEISKKIKKIILFGSAIDNKITFRSDIDLAVEFSNINLKEATLFRKRILGKVNGKIDVQVYNFLPNKLKQEINKNHKVLYLK